MVEIQTYIQLADPAIRVEGAALLCGRAGLMLLIGLCLGTLSEHPGPKIPNNKP